MTDQTKQELMRCCFNCATWDYENKWIIEGSFASYCLIDKINPGISTFEDWGECCQCFTERKTFSDGGFVRKERR